MKLEVKRADREDVYQDIARIPEAHRLSARGHIVPEGSVCKLSVGSHTAYALIRGLRESAEFEVRMDERLRNLLRVSVGDKIDVAVSKVGLYGQFRWAWSASDPAYRVAARLALLSVVLGLLGAALGLVSVVLALVVLGGSL